jgi:hypothetical protein
LPPAAGATAASSSEDAMVQDVYGGEKIEEMKKFYPLRDVKSFGYWF